MFDFYDEKIEKSKMDRIINKNIYHLPGNLEDKLIIDIGAQIGLFSYACLMRNAKFVYAYEVHPKKYELAKKNISKASSNFNIYNVAVWKSDYSKYKLSYKDLVPDTSSDFIVNAVSLDSVINNAVSEKGKIDILRVNCDGAEFPILYNSTSLYSVRNIVVKYYPKKMKIQDNEEVFEYTVEDLMQFLRTSGFMVFHKHNDNARMVFGTREILKQPFDIDIQMYTH